MAAASPADQPRPPRLARRHGDPAGPGRPHDLPARAASPRSACCGPTPTASATAATTGSAAARTTPRRTPRQGAFNADDVARAAVVYLRHWQQTGATTSRRSAPTSCCAALAYLQTAAGPNAGNVVLWMQPDGTLNPSADPWSCPTRPTRARPTGWPARSGPSARATRRSAARRPAPSRPSCARPARPRRRRARPRRCSTRYGTYRRSTGADPAWLVVDGADATAEAVLGLAAYVAAGGRPAARDALASWPRASPSWAAATPRVAVRRRAAVGAVALAAGTPGRRRCRPRWPGPRRRWATSRARRAGGRATRRPSPVAADLGRPRQRPAADPDRRRPDRLRRRLPAAVAARHRRRRPARHGLRRLAGIVAAWYFGANAAGQPAYDPATGRHRSTASRPTAASTTTRAPSRPSTGCCRCWRWTPTRTWQPRRPDRLDRQRVGNVDVQAEAGTTRRRGAGRHAAGRLDRGVEVRRHRIRLAA